MKPPPKLTDDAQKVLRVVNQRAADGYSLLGKTRLDRDKLFAAVEELMREELVQVKGDLNLEAIGEAYMFVPPDAKGLAEYLLGGPSSSNKS